MTVDVAIIHYGMGNLNSVVNAFTALGCHAAVARTPADLEEASRIVLPGVGAFGDGMAHLSGMGWIPAMEREVLQKGKPFLGICLGMQLLATTGTEHGEHAGLGWIAGTVTLMEPCDPALRIPHIGWNDVTPVAGKRLFEGLGTSPVFYFVHSYALHPDDPAVVAGTCAYGGAFVAAIETGNIMATQFHPEKSQKEGLTVLKNFLMMK